LAARAKFQVPIFKGQAKKGFDLSLSPRNRPSVKKSSAKQIHPGLPRLPKMDDKSMRLRQLIKEAS
jgi:hypothetical protein